MACQVSHVENALAEFSANFYALCKHKFIRKLASSFIMKVNLQNSFAIFYVPANIFGVIGLSLIRQIHLETKLKLFT